MHRSDAFSVFARAYLVKPISREQLFRTLDHLLKFHTDKSPRITFSCYRRAYSPRCADIVSLEKGGNYMCIMDCNGQTYRTRMTFAEAQTQVDSRFLVLMTGLMVNMDYIKV